MRFRRYSRTGPRRSLLSVAIDAYFEALAKALAGIRRTRDARDEFKEDCFERVMGRRFEWYTCFLAGVFRNLLEPGVVRESLLEKQCK